MAPADVEQEFSEDHGEDFLPETQPMAGPSRLSAAPSRLQPQRAAKRKRTERENAPVAESSVRRTKRQRRAGPVQPSGLPTPALPDPSPPLRTRRTKAELERAVMPSASTRCGLGGCNHKLYGDQDEVRAHVRFHYPHAPKPGKGSKEATKAGTKTKGKSKAPPPSSGSDDSEDSDDAESDASEDTSGISNAKNPVVCTYEAKGRPGQQCGEGYNSVLSLSRHLEHEHYGWKFPCPKCQTLLARRDALRRHLKKCQGPKTRKPPARR
ncbi:hypothetical protein C8Q70DRAFT_1054618 [Cubamyces menziesii]|nr:hypothetical protein C8Q70DRAFT_1054618 [Cubamyces menziesii]